MVSAALSDALFHPIVSLEELFSGYSGSKDDFPATVTKHFTTIFERDDAFLQIPQLSLDNPPESHQPGSLVRFRGMIQDTLRPEIYSYSIPGNDQGNSKPGGWGAADLVEYHEDGIAIDFANLKERVPYWVITVPGESDWVDQALSGEDQPSQRDKFTHRPPRPHKFPIPNAPHVGLNVKIYDPSIPVFKPTEIMTFVGILSSEILPPDVFETSEESDIRVPVLHVLFVRPVSWPAIQLDSLPRPEGITFKLISMSKSELLALRSELVDWIAHEALGGDRDAAEWILIASASRVHSRSPAILPTSLTVSSFPPPTATSRDATPTLHTILSLLLPLTQPVTLPKDLSPAESSTPGLPSDVSKLHFAPHSESEDLHSGTLQLPVGTVLTILEANIKEGRLPPGAAENLEALRTVLGAQKLQYRFPFTSGAGFEFPTDISAIVLCEGHRSLFLPDTDVIIPLRPLMRDQPSDSVLYKHVSQVRLPPLHKLAAYRALVCQAKVSSVKIGQEVAKYIQSDFVSDRQQAKGGPDKISSDDLVLRMKLCRPLAATFGESEVTSDIWDKLKVLDSTRKARLAKPVS